MYILGQDSNIIFTLDKGLFRGIIHTRDIYVQGKFYGSNIYGKKFFRRYLLGTYENDEAEQIVREIYNLLKSGQKFYSMPAPTIDIDLGVSI